MKNISDGASQYVDGDGEDNSHECHESVLIHVVPESKCNRK